MVPTMGGEDFAFIAEKVPGSFAFLGIGNPALNTTAGLHTYVLSPGSTRM